MTQRTTHILDRPTGENAPRQADLNAMWDLIEEHMEEDWKVNLDGSCSLVVDDRVMEKIFEQHPVDALTRFGAFEEHDEENRRYEWRNLPESLMGTYTIAGIYDANARYINGERTYYFSMEF